MASTRSSPGFSSTPPGDIAHTCPGGSGSRTGQVIREGIVPRHRLFLLPTEQPIEHAPISGRGNVGDGHRAFASGASVMPTKLTQVRDYWGQYRFQG